MMIPFNRDWLFFKGDICASGQRGFTKAGAWFQNGAFAGLDDKKWKQVDLPHDFMFEGEFTKASSDQTCPADLPDMGSIDSIHSSRGSLAGGVAWYRKHFYAPEGSKGKKVYIRFDGVCRDATVYVNQYRVTSHLNGFMGFVADVSDLLTYEGENILAVRVVDTLGDAIAHINRYNTGHSEAIITRSREAAARFQREVDAAAVYVNASTRFTDGGEFGFGAEIGISTQKLHARGPMGLTALTTDKYLVDGAGQVR